MVYRVLDAGFSLTAHDCSADPTVPHLVHVASEQGNDHAHCEQLHSSVRCMLYPHVYKVYSPPNKNHLSTYPYARRGEHFSPSSSVTTKIDSITNPPLADRLREPSG